jgi:hypothetical protein
MKRFIVIFLLICSCKPQKKLGVSNSTLQDQTENSQAPTKETIESFINKELKSDIQKMLRAAVLYKLKDLGHSGSIYQTGYGLDEDNTNTCAHAEKKFNLFRNHFDINEERVDVAFNELSDEFKKKIEILIHTGLFPYKQLFASGYDVPWQFRDSDIFKGISTLESENSNGKEYKFDSFKQQENLLTITNFATNKKTPGEVEFEEVIHNSSNTEVDINTVKVKSSEIGLYHRQDKKALYDRCLDAWSYRPESNNPKFHNPCNNIFFASNAKMEIKFQWPNMVFRSSDVQPDDSTSNHNFYNANSPFEDDEDLYGAWATRFPLNTRDFHDLKAYFEISLIPIPSNDNCSYLNQNSLYNYGLCDYSEIYNQTTQYQLEVRLMAVEIYTKVKIFNDRYKQLFDLNLNAHGGWLFFTCETPYIQLKLDQSFRIAPNTSKIDIKIRGGRAVESIYSMDLTKASRLQTKASGTQCESILENMNLISKYPGQINYMPDYNGVFSQLAEAQRLENIPSHFDRINNIVSARKIVFRINTAHFQRSCDIDISEGQSFDEYLKLVPKECEFTFKHPLAPDHVCQTVGKKQ